MHCADIIAVICIISIFASSCSVKSTRDNPTNQPENVCTDKADITESALLWADSVCNALSTVQRAAQLLMPAVYASSDRETISKCLQYGNQSIGGIILLKGSMPEAKLISDTLATVCKIPMIVAIDAEWGLAMRLRDGDRYPYNSTLGDVEDDRSMYDYGSEIADQCRRIGINMVLGPVLDVDREDHATKFSFRSFGADAKKVSHLGVAYARGLEDGGVISVAKHFPGHGSPITDSHKSLAVIDKSLYELDSLDLRPFRDYIAQGLSAVMAGHLAVPAIDPEMKPAAFSSVVLKDLLRNDMGFKGLVLTDAINMDGAQGRDAATAILAGADIVLAPYNTDKELTGIVATVPDSVISERCKRILFYKFLFANNRTSTGYGEVKNSNDKRN